MKKLLFIGLAFAVYAAPACAASDPLVEGAKLCTRHMPRYEREYGIPTHLLSAIATTESGRYHKELKISVPWPWTINAEGKGYYFDSKAEAVAAARRLYAQGVRSMDVGCMQVNLYHHPDAFSSLENAFEPQANVAYASSFLRTLYGESNSWKKAAADYHSKTPARGSEYVGMVFNSWYKIIDKLRAARMVVPDVPARQQVADNIATAQANPVKLEALPEQKSNEPAYTRVASTTDVRYVRPTVVSQPERLPEQEGRKVAAYQSPRMNSISVSTRHDDIMVLKPEIKVVDDSSARSQPVTLKVAQANTTSKPQSYVSVRNSSDEPGKRNGPRFIFTD